MPEPGSRLRCAQAGRGTRWDGEWSVPGSRGCGGAHKPARGSRAHRGAATHGGVGARRRRGGRGPHRREGQRGGSGTGRAEGGQKTPAPREGSAEPLRPEAAQARAGARQGAAGAGRPGDAGAPLTTVELLALGVDVLHVEDVLEEDPGHGGGSASRSRPTPADDAPSLPPRTARRAPFRRGAEVASRVGGAIPAPAHYR